MRVVPVLRASLALAACLSALAALLACSGKSSTDSKPREVVLYYSADDTIAKPVIDAFEKQTGVHVLGVGDTEATKTTGLVQRRLRSEKDRPRADVFWSSEVFLTIRLANEGILAPNESPALNTWPAGLRDPDHRWCGFAQRARVVVYNTNRVAPQDTPRGMVDLMRPRWKGRIAMARPGAGTTRGHMAALVALWGEDAARAWLQAMRDNSIRLYDGNSAVVQAVANGEADVGLTDTDDAYAGERNHWPVDFLYITHTLPGAPEIGPLLIPNTVALVAGGPNPAAAALLADFLLSAPVERMLAESESRNFPVHPELAIEFGVSALPAPARIELRAIADSMDTAMRLCSETIGG